MIGLILVFHGQWQRELSFAGEIGPKLGMNSNNQVENIFVKIITINSMVHMAMAMAM